MERFQFHTLREFLMDQLAAEPEAAAVTIDATELRRQLALTDPGSGTKGATVRDLDRGIAYRVTLDTTTKPNEARLHSVEIIREVIPDGLLGFTAKGGLRRKGKPGTYLAPYDESAFRVPVQELVAQTLAVLASPGIVIGARRLAPPTPEQLRAHLADGLTVQQIADRYERKPRMVYGWLATARTAAPELKWPEVKHGPAPASTKQTTGSDGEPGNRKRETHE